MPTTALGLVYPSSTDHVRLWEHLQSLATTADTAIAARALAPIWKRKTANQSVTNSTTLTNDTDLAASVAINSVYALDASLLYAAPTANDMKIAWTWPTGAGLQWGLITLDPAAGGFAGNLTPTAFDGVASGSSFSVGGGGASNTLLTIVRGTLTTGSTAGTLQLQFAQITAGSGTAAVMKAGSTLKLEKIG